MSTQQEMRPTVDQKRYRRRLWINRIAISLAIFAMAFGLFWLLWILWETIIKGISGLSWLVFTESTPAPHDEGGLLNALYGSLAIVAMATFIGTPIGIMAGICLAEYNPKGPLAQTTRFINDILLSAPSIIIGIFVWIVMVRPMGHASAYAGSVALALIVIPVVIRTTENMLMLVPVSLREAGFALGAPKWWVISSVCLRAAKAGVLTGILLALARISGETAPLLFTALNNQFWSTDLSQPMANLPSVIFKFAMSPYSNWQELAWAGVFILTLTVLLFNILARYLARRQ